MKKKDITFSSSQLELLREFYSSHLSIGRFAEKKGISRVTFWRWVRIFEGSNPEISDYMKRSTSPSVSEESSSITSLRLENERLRTELKEANMRACAYERMIDVAEEMFNLPIRKKAGTKQ